jgi:hypothetical protein
MPRVGGPTIPNRTHKATVNDIVMTPDWVAKWAIDHFQPTGVILEPCRGSGAFFKAFPDGQSKEWCEITEGKDFLDYDKKVDWIITNPPFSIYDTFLLKSLKLADNVVFLTPLVKAFKSQKIDKKVAEFGGLKEIVTLGGGRKIGFPFGFQVGFLYYKRGWSREITYTRSYSK